nr:MAG: hypothetical protein [Apis mellifra filamentous-like virus]
MANENGDDVGREIEEARRKDLVTRLLYRRWKLLNDMETFIIESTEQYRFFDRSEEKVLIEENVLMLIKRHHQMRVARTIATPSKDFNVLKTSNHTSKLLALSDDDLHEILGELDQLQRTIHELTAMRYEVKLHERRSPKEAIDVILPVYMTLLQF